MKGKGRGLGTSLGTGGGGGGIVVEATSRKARRKEQRLAKKKKHHPPSKPRPREETAVRAADARAASSKNKRPRGGSEDGSGKKVKFSSVVEERTIPPAKNRIPIGLKKSSRASSQAKGESTTDHFDLRGYDHHDDETAAAFRRDDMEIQYLESELGIQTKKKGSAKELNREYAKNEGFGDDFGDFLMGLDNLVERVAGGEDAGGSDGESIDNDSDGSDGEDERKQGIKYLGSDSDDEAVDAHNDVDDPYAHLGEETALAFRSDDAEIAALEEKLGLASSKKAKKKLNKEFASTFQGYGEDFGDFLEDLEGLGNRVRLGATGRGDGSVESEASVDSHDSMEGSDHEQQKGNVSEDESEASDEDSNSEESAADVADHDVALTYRPTSGEDIYGNKIDASGGDTPQPTKYVPPHLRKKLGQEAVDATDNADEAPVKTAPSKVTEADPETIKRIQRSLNNCLNRLSEQTLESVSKSIASLYSQYPFHDMNDCLWKNIQTACVPPHLIMSGLIPLYIGAMAGVHWLGGDGIHLGECVVEWSVAKLHDSLAKCRAVGTDAQDEHEKINKEASNLLLIVCYLYNYGVIHCNLIYDLVRESIKHFAEIDVEALLLVLSHCGPQLRADDPSALREIVLLVKDRAKEVELDGATAADTSRVQYMIDGIIELKNNKPRKQDAVVREKTNALKKCLGRVKSLAAQSLAGKKSGSCLRVTLRDILDAETKGRWWIAGAQWAGHQYRGDEDALPDDELHGNDLRNNKAASNKVQGEEDGLLSLAASQRMNTDARRAIFCIVMGSSDCDDAFEKLVRQGMLKPKAERDVIRVIVHCCGEEKAFNPFYAYLAMRCCEYQHKSRFTLMLTFADVFKQLETFSVRKAANLAKLMAHLIGSGGKCLTIGVLKRIEFSPSDMPEMVVVFLSVFMTTLFESFDSESVREIFSHGMNENDSSKKAKKQRRVDSDDEDDGRGPKTTRKEDLSELRENMSTFMLQYLKSSPKNVKGSEFHSNYETAMRVCDSNQD